MTRFFLAWCSGFLCGHIWLANSLLPITFDKITIDLCFAIFGTVAITIWAINHSFARTT